MISNRIFSKRPIQGKAGPRSRTAIPDGAYVHAVRQDPKRKGLLYAGTETGVFVSFDDGANWQRLQLNLPTSPIHDLVVKDDDLVVATHGRSFWVLDNLTPLRQVKRQFRPNRLFCCINRRSRSASITRQSSINASRSATIRPLVP